LAILPGEDSFAAHGAAAEDHMLPEPEGAAQSDEATAREALEIFRQSGRGTGDVNPAMDAVSDFHCADSDVRGVQAAATAAAVDSAGAASQTADEDVALRLLADFRKTKPTTEPRTCIPVPAPAPAPALAEGGFLRLSVGDHLVSVARVLMRTGESLNSAQVGFLPADRLLEVLELGCGRRVHVLEQGGVEGWLSVSKLTGEQLLAPTKISAREAYNFRSRKEEMAASKKAPAPAPAPAGPKAICATNGSSGKCDKCDGPHATAACPFFKKDREDHKDAWANYGQKNPLKMGGDGGDFTLQGATVVRQPGDGSCLFHSLSFGLSSGRPSPYAAESLRRELAAFIERNPSLEIAGDTIEEWVRWDANSSVSAYAQQMGRRGWGGGVEMAVCSLLKDVNVHVYEHSYGSAFRRISCFDTPGSKKTVHVLYQGRCHYDALVPAQ